MTKLNANQQQAVEYISGPLLVLAGAGSGKTSVITQKIIYLIEKCGIEPRHIAAVTFTNKASREMKERVSRGLKGNAASGLTVSTFHNLGLTIIRHEYKALGFKPGFSIFDPQDTQAILKDFLPQAEAKDQRKVEQCQSTISNLKNELITPEEAIQQASSGREMAIARIYKEYNECLRAYNGVDFDDLIMLPVLVFREHPAIIEKWQSRLRYLLVDEYQDTNSSQYELVKQLAGMRQALTVVGDDDQSIYAWRGARPENLTQLQEDYPHLKLIKLEQNYRSTRRILKAANILIANNPHNFEKRLWSELGEGEPIRIIKTENEDAEADRVVTEIIDLNLKRRIPYEDFAILYRGNHQARLLEMKLQAHQVPYQISGGISFFSRNEIKDIMAYLRLLINRNDDNAFLRIINVPRRKIGSATLQGLASYANERHISLYAAVDEIGLGQHLKPGHQEKLKKFVSWMNKVAKNCEQSDPMQAVREMIDDIDYEAWLLQNSSSDSVAENRMGNVRFLIQSLQNTLKADGEDLSMKEAIAKLVLRDLLEQQNEDEAGTNVQLLTLHAAKGLEYPYVFITGLEEEILPHRNSVAEGNVEEERRLLYVGITRARQSLTMLYARRRKQHGGYVSNEPSRFLEELPQGDLEWYGQEVNEELNQQRGKETIQGLKNLFD